MTSLRRTALLWMTVLLALVGVAAVVIAYGLARSEAAGFLDSQLRQIALNAGEGLPETAGPPVEHDPEDEFALTIWDGAGKKIHASPLDIDIPRQANLGFANIRAAADEWRVYTSSDGVRTVQVAQRQAVRQELATRAAIEAAAPILAVIPLSWLVIGWAMNRLLARLDALAHEIAARSAGAAEPIPLDGIPVEVAPLVTAMNQLIARQRLALDQQKRFLSDAAHELRTPLAALQIQVDGLNAGSAASLEDRKGVLAQGIRRAGSLVSQLLRLARLDHQDPPPARHPVELAPLLLSCVAAYVDIAEQKGVDLGVTEQQPAIVHGSADELQVLFANLIDNALRYTPPGGCVDVSLQVSGGAAVTEIVDSGMGIPKGAETRVFDRFFRAAPASIEGTGLGLAIVRGIADRHGLSVSVGNRMDGNRGVCARVVVPVSPGSPADLVADPGNSPQTGLPS